MIRTGLGALLSHWIRRPFQLVTLVLGLATATALWSGVQAINAEARTSYDRAATVLAGPARDRLEAPGGTLPLDRFVTLRRAGWPVSPILEGRIETAAGPISIVGIEPFSLPQGDLPFETTDGPESDAPTGFFTGEGQLLVAPETADALADAPELPPRVATDGIAPGIAYADIVTSGRLLGQEGRASALILTGAPTRVAPPLDEIAPDLSRSAPQDGPDIASLTDSFHLNLTAFGLLSFAVGLFIVRGAIGLAFEQRRPVFRTLRALGLSRRLLVGLLAAELLVLATLAGAIGVVLGWLLATLLLPDVAATLRGLYGAQVSGSLSLRPAWWLAGLAIAVGGTAVAAAGSLWQVYRLPLLAPAQPRAWARASARAMRWQVAAALMLLIAGAAIHWVAGGLVAGFTLLGALLVGAALLLPAALALLLAGLSRIAPSALAEWFWADTRQQLPGLSLALMALLLALAANIGVGTMVSSFRLTFTGWLDQRLASELYITAETAEEVPPLLEFLDPRTEAILPIRNVDAEIAGRPGEIYGVADHPTYTENWPLVAAGPDVWARVAAGEAVLINEQLARAEDIWPGGEVALPDGPAPVAGVYSDYGNPSPQVLMGLSRFDATFPDAPRLRYGLRLDPGDTDALRRALVEEFGLPEDNLVDQRALKQLSLDIFERTFTVTSALNVLTLSVAGFAILTSLLTLATMRQPQLAPIWALGLTRRRLAQLELARAVLLAALTFLAALPVGLMLAFVLLTVVNVEAFGWRLPMHLFPADWAWLFVLSLAAAVAASLLPALRLARTPPSDLLKVFAHER